MLNESISVSPASSFLAAWLCPAARSKHPVHNDTTKQTDAPLGLRSEKFAPIGSLSCVCLGVRGEAPS